MRLEAEQRQAAAGADARSVFRRALDPWLNRVLVVALTLLLMPMPAPLQDLPPPMHVDVRGKTRGLPPGTTVARLMALEPGARPRDGNFIDVRGAVLARGRYPGRVLVNGQEAGPETVLEHGDVVRVVRGRDRREPLVEEAVKIPGGRVANPQSFIGSVPGVQVTTRGAVSGKAVSSVFRAFGGVEAPPQVVLTFDDGPSPTFTPRILQILKRSRAKATFFVVGTMVKRHPEIVHRLVKAGMTVANHTYAHPITEPFADLPRARIREEIAEGGRVLRDLGIEPVGFRPPLGSWSPLVRDEAERLGMRTVLWAVDSRDWMDLSADRIVVSVLRNARRGAIILLHDGGGDRTATVAALPRIIEGLRARGLEPVALT